MGIQPVSITGNLSSRVVASGAGWSVSDVVCTAGPETRAFEEQHADFLIAAVRQGTFRYRTEQGSAVLAPGALILGNAGACFECGHDHSAGDRCLAFRFEPAYLDAIVTSVPSARRLEFGAARIPALPGLARVVAEAEAVCAGAAGSLETLALELAGNVIEALAGSARAEPPLASRDEKRISETLRFMEERCAEALTIADLAAFACMSPYHFVRTFRRVAGVTPHQFLLRLRLARAAARIRASGDAISAIAFDVGFNDLSTFNRMFRNAIGMSPSEFRRARSAARSAAS